MGDAGTRQGAIHLDIVNARDPEDGVNSIGFQETDECFTG
jgi:hypothetical protein